MVLSLFLSESSHVVTESSGSEAGQHQVSKADLCLRVVSHLPDLHLQINK